jgi:hypothetical protein
MLDDEPHLRERLQAHGSGARQRFQRGDRAPRAQDPLTENTQVTSHRPSARRPPGHGQDQKAHTLQSLVRRHRQCGKRPRTTDEEHTSKKAPRKRALQHIRGASRPTSPTTAHHFSRTGSASLQRNGASNIDE